MYEEARRYREDRKAKAERLASGDPHEKVDSSSWSPPEQLEANKKTGLKPVSPRQFRRGGKVHSVEGEHEHRRADRKPRASGGRSVANSIATTDEKAANKDEFGAEHIGALRHGGRARAHKLYGGPLAPALAAGYPGGGGDVPAARMGFQGGPSQLSRAIGIKEGGKVKRAKGGSATGGTLAAAQAAQKRWSGVPAMAWQNAHNARMEAGTGKTPRAKGGRIGKFMGGGFGGMGGGMGQPGMAQPMGGLSGGFGQMGGQGMPNLPPMPSNAPPMMQMSPQFQRAIGPLQSGQFEQGLREQLQQQLQAHGVNTTPQFQMANTSLGGFPGADRLGDGDQGNRARGGKVSEGLKVEHRIVKKAKGGEVGHTELHHEDCRCAKCTGGMTKGGHVEHHHEDCTCAKCSGGEVREHRANGGGNWIAGATKNKGALHKALHVPEGEKIPAKKLSKAEHSKNPTMRKRADLAETLRGINREHHAKGGRAKGKQTVNIVIAPGGQRPSGMNPMAAPPQPPHPAQPIPMPSPPMPMGGGMPYPMPIPGGMSPPTGMPMGGLGGVPPGMPPRPFKHGGYAGAKAGEGAGGGEGRLKKRRAYGKEARGAGPNQAV